MCKFWIATAVSLLAGCMLLGCGGGGSDGGGSGGTGGGSSGGGSYVPPPNDPTPSANKFDAYDLQGTWEVERWTNFGGSYGFPGETEADYWQKDALLSIRAIDANHVQIRGDYVFNGKTSMTNQRITIINSSRTAGVLQDLAKSCANPAIIFFPDDDNLRILTNPSSCNGHVTSDWHWNRVGHLPYNKPGEEADPTESVGDIANPTSR